MKKTDSEIVKLSKQLDDKELLKLMLTNVNFLDPVIFILCVPSSIEEKLPYKKYLQVMKKRALKSRNKALLELVLEKDKINLSI